MLKGGTDKNDSSSSNIIRTQKQKDWDCKTYFGIITHSKKRTEQTASLIKCEYMEKVEGRTS